MTLQNFAIAHPKITSAIHTFVPVFIVAVIAQISTVPADSILSPSTWTYSFIVGIIVTAGRAAFKAVSPLTVA